VDREHSLFADLDRIGPFHRDSAVGRIFHPGTASFREITPNDSLHIAVSADNRVSVHVDRLSPLAVRPGRECRYSFVRAVAHNVVHLADVVGRRWHGRGAARRCDLECEASRPGAAVPGVYEFSCRAAGAEGSGWVTRATSEDELVAQVAEHARRVHGVRQFSGTVAAYAVEIARQGGARR
jgi:predicted small metal-binding protein